MSFQFYTAELGGGLGNQMFQIAHAICQGLKNNVESVFPTYSSTPNQGFQPTKYINNIYKNINFTEQYPICYCEYQSNFNDLLGFYDTTKNIEFRGYFQGSHNFLGYDNEVRSLFSPPPEFVFQKILEYPGLTSDDSVSVHIRRGDYLMFQTIHPTIDLSYINKCLEISEKRKIFVFSDDKDWAKKTFEGKNYTVVEGLEDYEELWMMSLCRDNILSPSTFSWWGAFLNKNENKKVFVPNIWFGDEITYRHDKIYEKDWIRITVKNINGKLYYDEN
jgi:hypothetical protein